MKKFRVVVNGEVFEVEVEEVEAGAAAPVEASRAVKQPPVTPPPPPSPVSTPRPAAAPGPSSTVQAAEGEETVTAPMPGNVLDIKVAVGDTVEAGQLLLMLEAMKMENEILAPRAGKVVAVKASKGQSVNTGDILLVLA